MIMGARLIIGVGNPDRGDDAVGRAVAQQLKGRVPEGVEVLEEEGEMTALLEHLEEADEAYLIDASASGEAPGTVRRFDAAAAPLPNAVMAVSTHGFGLAEAIEMARAMGTLPATCLVYAVEGAGFEAGEPLSEPVAAAVAQVAEKIVADVTNEEVGAD